MKDTMIKTMPIRVGGIGFDGALALLFIGLKLGGVAPVALWSWWWVLSPLWLPLVLILGIIFVVMVCAIVIAMVK